MAFLSWNLQKPDGVNIWDKQEPVGKGRTKAGKGHRLWPVQSSKPYLAELRRRGAYSAKDEHCNFWLVGYLWKQCLLSWKRWLSFKSVSFSIAFCITLKCSSLLGHRITYCSLWNVWMVRYSRHSDICVWIYLWSGKMLRCINSKMNKIVEIK